MSQHTLSADSIARAIIAASRVLKLDPIEALTSISSRARSPIAPAVYGLARALDVPVTRLCHIMGSNATNVSHAKRRRGDIFWSAALAAEDAVRAPRAPCPQAVRGPIVGWATPSITPRKPALSGPRSLRDEILSVLVEAPSSAPSLAVLCDGKEMDVTGALRLLEYDGLVTAGAIPAQGVRYRQWTALPPTPTTGA